MANPVWIIIINQLIVYNYDVIIGVDINHCSSSTSSSWVDGIHWRIRYLWHQGWVSRCSLRIENIHTYVSCCTNDQ